MTNLLVSLPWPLVIAGALTLGLAPFTPPHLVEKLQMLFAGTLVKPLDWFDLLFHAAPWLLLFAKVAAHAVAAWSATPDPG